MSFDISTFFSPKIIKQINDYVFSKFDLNSMPLYCSVDIRDAGFKTAVVDTNLFPAGFNNLNKQNETLISDEFKLVINEKVSNVKEILLIVENNTRNKWYLENVAHLSYYLTLAGFNVTISAFLDEYSEACQNQGYVKLESQLGEVLKIECTNRVADSYKAKERSFDLIILNNDLMSGIPSLLNIFDVPILPKAHLGWHSRLKSDHFMHVASILAECSTVVDFDPWLLSCYQSNAENVNIMQDADISFLAGQVQNIIDKTQLKYNQYNITDKPFVMMKANSGTYGMGVMNFDSGEAVLNMNRKTKNKLAKGKHSSSISSFLIQEGVSTRLTMDDKVVEPCMYYIGHECAGGFYRTNELKNSRQNLNSLGMGFAPLSDDINSVIDLYKCLARISILAVIKET